jgi:hypothetical protein
MSLFRQVFSLRSLTALVLLLTVMSGLASGMENSIRGLTAPHFFPVAAYAVTLGWVLGFSRWRSRPAWTFLVVSSLLFVFILTA